MAEAPSLRVEGGVKRFGGLRALDDIDVEVPTEGITAIIGPNGAGKTTLLDALTGFSRLDGGRVFLGETEITRFPPARIARLGLARTFQDVRLVWSETVLDNVMVASHSPAERIGRALSGRGVAGEERRIRPIADRALQTVGLEDCAAAPASTLSYGQQKLLMLARCLVSEARWLVLDEPMAGIAPPLVRKTIAVLGALARDQCSVLFIEHDVQSVRELADNVIFLDRGRVIAAGPTEEVLDRSDLVRAYLD